ncbi:MAG: hypothetical protein M1837_006982 [Sclerophora amabilis]|nr:MAG: hypothetical protein M1837_006982 [Sclerophora amabilis]
MQLTTLLSGLAFAGVALATHPKGYGDAGADSGATAAAASAPAPASTGAAAPPAESPSSGGVTVHVVKVSNKDKDLVFCPNDIKAAVGELVQFQFYPMNHSVVQSTFDKPCEPIAKNSPGVQGLFSGFMPVKPTDTVMPAYTIAINDTKPIWFYCSQAKHCSSGMVGVINAPADKTLDAHKALAKDAQSAASGGSGYTPGTSTGPVGGSGNSSSLGSAGAGSPSGTGAPVAPSGTDLPIEANSVNSIVSESRAGGIVFGGLVALAMFAFA